MDRSYVGRNDATLERLRRLLASLSEADLAQSAEGGWTVGSLLGHLAHWDRFVLVRWQARGADQLTPADVPDHVADLVNDAAMPIWAALDLASLRELVVRAAENTNALVAGVPDEALDALDREGRPRLVDRSRHRTEHLDAIDRALGRTG